MKLATKLTRTKYGRMARQISLMVVSLLSLVDVFESFRLTFYRTERTFFITLASQN